MPVRFVRACRCGHIGDIDWYSFVHGGASECAGQHRQLWIDERGTSGDLTEVWIRCECGKAERNMAQAAMLQDRALGHCDGYRPWLGPVTKEPCGEPNRLLIRTASNAYFPQKMTVISLPDRDETVKQAVDAAWEFLEAVEEMDELRYERKKAKVKAALEGVTDDEAFAEIQCRRAGGPKEEKKVKIVRVGDADREQRRTGRRPSQRAFLRPRLTTSSVGQPVDAVHRTCGARPSAARSRCPSRIHALRGRRSRH